jgi:flagellin
LASGSRIVQASDDASGLAISEQLRASATELQQDTVNISQAQSLLHVADGGLAQISAILSRMMALASESASGQVTDSQRSQDIDSEYQTLAKEINSVASSAQYNGQSLLNYQNSTGAFSWESSSVLTGFYEAQVLRNTTFGADATEASGATGNFADTGQIAKYGSGVDGLPTGTSGTFDAASLEGLNNAPFGPANFLTGTGSAGMIGLTIGAFNTATLGLEQDTVSYQDSGTTSVTVAGPGNTTIVESVGTYLSTHPTEVFSGQVSYTVNGGKSNVATQSAAMTAIATLSAALSKITEERATIGAYESRFTFSQNAAETNLQNTTAAMSVIADADVAEVKAHLSSQDVQNQAAIAALVQAQQLPTELLRLIQS